MSKKTNKSDRGSRKRGRQPRSNDGELFEAVRSGSARDFVLHTDAKGKFVTGLQRVWLPMMNYTLVHMHKAKPQMFNILGLGCISCSPGNDWKECAHNTVTLFELSQMNPQLFPIFTPNVDLEQLINGKDNVIFRTGMDCILICNYCMKLGITASKVIAKWDFKELCTPLPFDVSNPIDNSPANDDSKENTRNGALISIANDDSKGNATNDAVINIVNDDSKSMNTETVHASCIIVDEMDESNATKSETSLNKK